ncbi:hypothetical protein D3C73_616210 [compost metagenome]
MSLSRVWSVRLEEWINASISCCCGDRSVRASAWATPMTPFSGVRISWLILARKRLLARLAASAASRASARASASRFRSVMSEQTVTTPPPVVGRSWTLSQRSPTCISRGPAGVRRLAIRSTVHAASRPAASG